MEFLQIRWRGVLIVALLFCGSILGNQVREYERAQEYLAKYGEVYFSFTLTASTDLYELTEIISLDHSEGNLMYAYANPEEFKNFAKQGILYTVEKHSADFYDPSHMYNGDLKDFTGQGLLNYDKYVELMNQHAKDYPEICKLYKFGESIKGKEMLCLRITKGLPSTGYTKKPRFLFGCAVHGDELSGTKISYGLMDFLLKGYKNRDPIANKYLEGLEIWIAPHLNPDGTFPNGNTMSGCKRGNSRGMDLNRDYPAPNLSEEAYNEAVAKAQKETENSMKFELEHKFNMGFDYHDGMTALVCHWSKERKRPVDWPWMQYVGAKYTKIPKVGQAAYDWYPATGTRMDWQPFYGHCWGFTVEVGRKGTGTSATWSGHQSSVLAVFDEAMCGIRGTVVDENGNGLDNVKIVLKKGGSVWDKWGSEAYSVSNGFYTHYAPAGTYDVEFSLGSKKQEAKNITVTNGQPTPLNMNLDNGSTTIQSFNLNTISPLSFKYTKNQLKISWHRLSSPITVSIYRLDGTLITSLQPDISSSSLIWDFTVNNQVLTNGCYLAKVVKVSGQKVDQRKFIFAR